MTIKSQFDLDIPVFVIAKEELEDIYIMLPIGGEMTIRKSMII